MLGLHGPPNSYRPPGLYRLCDSYLPPGLHCLHDSHLVIGLHAPHDSHAKIYIAVGSIYPTSSKETARVVGLERLRQVRQAVTLPLVAIGGITRDNAAEIMAAGANAVAVISAVSGAENVEDAARQIVARLETPK